MSPLKILQLILQFAPAGVALTKALMELVSEISDAVKSLPAEHQEKIAEVAAKSVAHPPGV